MQDHECKAKSLILLVDDDPSICEMLRFILERDGFATKSASNGKVALNSLSSIDRPCMILLDMMMPEMNGWQFYRALLADQRFHDIPVVIASAFSKKEIAMPPVEVLSKPINIPLLRNLAFKYSRQRLGPNEASL